MRFRRFASALTFVSLITAALILGSIGIGADNPRVIGSRPASNETDVKLCDSVSVDVELPPVEGNGVAAATLNSSTVYLYRTSDGPSQKVNANLNTTGGGDAVTLTPILFLSPLTQYTFVITNGLEDLADNAFEPFTISFTTGTNDCSNGSPVAFKQIVTYQNEDFPSLTSDPNLRGKYSSLAIGPDGRLYAAMIHAYVDSGAGYVEYAGGIRVFDIRRNNQSTDGLLKFAHEITALNNRSVIGLEFDPDSTPNNPILWVTSNTPLYYPPNHPDNDSNTNFSSEIARLTVSNLGQPSESWTAETWIDGLPRSKKDHLANSLELGPDGKLYMTMGSQSAMGAADNAWANRTESILSGAVLRIDIQKMKQHVTSSQLELPLHVSTRKSGGTSYNLNEAGNPYNPTAPGAYVQIFATGVRNAYDLVWHTNGQLYVPTNGSAAGGNSPAYSNNTSCSPRFNGQNYNGSTSVPALTGVSTQKDYLFRVVQGKYYGHPNPSRCEWVLNGGHSNSTTPTGTVINEYPLGTNPDPNYAGISWDMGYNKSPNGTIEYRGAAFNGALLGKLMVVRYSGNNDILVLTPGGATKDIIAEEEAIAGFTGFNNPLDLVEDTTTGNIYLSEYQDETDFEAGRIVLLKPDLNRTPIATSDYYVIGQNTSLNVPNAEGVLSNDIDADGDPLTAVQETTPSHHVGEFILKNGGGFDYTPEPGFIGVDTFYYRPNDGQGNGNLGSVTISVTDGGPNEPPDANNDNYVINENQTLNVNVEDGVLDNDTDPNNDFLIAQYVEGSGPASGNLTFNADGSFVYTPVQAFSGVVTFEYRADDNRGGKNKATVTITVNEFNYPPEVTGEVYYVVVSTSDNPVTAIRDVTRGVLKNDTDSNFDVLSASPAGGPSHDAEFQLNADGSFSYRPDNGYLGLDSFTYMVDDGQGGTGFGIATINVVEAPLEFELLTNGRLEDKKPSNFKQPMAWVAKALYNDKVVCNRTDPSVKIFAYEGDCAFKFVGNKNSPQMSYLQQVTQSDDLEKGDTLTLSVFVQGKNVVNNAAFLKVTVKYLTGKNDNFKLKIPKGSYPYTSLTQVIQLNQNRQVDVIKTRIAYSARGVSGNFLIDGVSLWKESSVSIPPETLRGEGEGDNLIPLPADPLELRGSN